MSAADEFPIGSRWTDTGVPGGPRHLVVLATVEFDGTEFVICGNHIDATIEPVVAAWARNHFEAEDGVA